MNHNKTTFQYALNYGIALGLSLSLIELLAFLLGLLDHWLMGFINIALVVSMISIALKKNRDQFNNGILPFGKAFLIGLFTCLISGAIWSIYRLIEYSLEPSIIENILLQIEEKLLESSISEDQIESMMKIYTMLYTAPFLALSTFIFNMGIGGSILSLIMAAIFKRDQNPLLTDSSN